MVKAIALWSRPADVEAFESDYFGRHIPLAESAGVPGMRELKTFRASADDAAFYRVAELIFDSQDDLDGALTSPELAKVLADGQRVESEHGVSVVLLTVTADPA
ncbi:MAG: EthD family reductase [Actinobacteria bacterium]|nr:EthD family reductase [Actinomycetota bacterium]